ncbi:hypothetical protein Desmer_1381 [Desulfosporosinus meridiei DSM 13257]|uniref:Uncharacterized protein n=1 Tax=Desulfosporosinus meridiei (strain ATCC BAA-275 / DSM 13257 / KCTC 12902 / NCIMB 13706 / S10) TaxID=768704 RepID=J7IXE7_DESMD|nr:hypothetical protein Desmer_1381 [Desulfosporosinus meridiei DSM 13257]
MGKKARNKLVILQKSYLRPYGFILRKAYLTINGITSDVINAWLREY